MIKSLEIPESGGQQRLLFQLCYVWMQSTRLMWVGQRIEWLLALLTIRFQFVISHFHLSPFVQWLKAFAANSATLMPSTLSKEPQICVFSMMTSKIERFQKLCEKNAESKFLFHENWSVICRLSLMKVALELCEPILSNEILNLFADDYLEVSNVKRFLDLAPTLEDTLVFCRFRDQTTNCSELFDPIVTEDGLCYTFNTLNSIDVRSHE